jgi:hypothetical protein
MISKTKTALIAAFVLGSASAAHAQSNEQFESSQYLRNPNAPVAAYQNQSVQSAPALIEGRNVAVQQEQQWQVSRGQALTDRSINLAF